MSTHYYYTHTLQREGFLFEAVGVLLLCLNRPVLTHTVVFAMLHVPP